MGAEMLWIELTLSLLEDVKCTEHSVGQVTAEEMTLYMRRNPESPTHRQLQEQTVTNTAHLMTSD